MQCAGNEGVLHLRLAELLGFLGNPMAVWSPLKLQRGLLGSMGKLRQGMPWVVCTPEN